VDIPFSDLLLFAGLDVDIEKKMLPTIGRVRIMGARNRIFSIDEKGAAAKAGVRRGDTLVSANGRAVSGPENLAEIIAALSIGDTLRLGVQRDGVGLSFDAIIEGREKTDCEIGLLPHASSDQLEIRKGLFQR
jgi:predicted metalloprotease with PDZ domain